jgi:hypothetical protein
VPYHLAQFWDSKSGGGLRERVEERKAAFAAHRKTLKPTLAGGVLMGTKAPVSSRADVGKVPRELRATAKRTPAVALWLRALEEPVRQFLMDHGAVARPAASVDTSSDDEDEEIVFVGRNGTMRDGARAWKKARKETRGGVSESGMVLESLGDDESAAFKYAITPYFFLSSSSLLLPVPRSLFLYSHSPLNPGFITQKKKKKASQGGQQD